jgi:hypothetical protein
MIKVNNVDEKNLEKIKKDIEQVKKEIQIQLNSLKKTVVSKQN